MDKITEKDLIELDFTKFHVTKEESGDVAFNYYTLDITDNFCLITNDITSNDIEVFVYEDNSIKIVSLKDLKELIRILKSNK